MFMSGGMNDSMISKQRILFDKRLQTRRYITDVAKMLPHTSVYTHDGEQLDALARACRFNEFNDTLKFVSDRGDGGFGFLL